MARHPRWSEDREHELARRSGHSRPAARRSHDLRREGSGCLLSADRAATAAGGGGFEHFYGFIGGETNQYVPAIYDGTTPVEPDRTPEEGYHFTEDMTDHTIDWGRQQKALMADKPFFVYYAPGATQAPHHVPPEWSAKYLKDGRPAHCYNLFGLERFKVYGESAVPPGEHQVRAEFAYDGGGLGRWRANRGASGRS
jgi:hypothetical protein